MRTLLVDNHDSFTFNLFQYLAAVTGTEPDVVCNDDRHVDPQLVASYHNVVLSPGPGTPRRPSDLGICADIVREARVPVLGVCLGHQAVAHGYGAVVDRAPEPWHGRVSPILHAGTGLFADLPSPFNAVRYHSLHASELPESLQVLAWTDDGLVMALRHRTLPLWGVQFHPESICTEHGMDLLRNFVDLTRRWWKDRRPESLPGPVASGRHLRARPHGDRRRAMRVRVRSLPTRWDEEVVFDRLFRRGSHAFWLDSSARDDDSGRFSIMGDAEGALARVAKVDVSSRTVTVTSAHGSQRVEDGFFNWLMRDLDAFKIRIHSEDGDDGELPFDYRLGWLGYLGYELKAECGGRATHRSTEPDAVMVFPERVLVFDHVLERTSILVLEPDLPEAGSGTSDLPRPDLPVPDGVRQRVPDQLDATVAQLEALAGVAADDRLPPPHAYRASLGPLRARNGRDDYLERIRVSQERIVEGETYEVCLTNLLHASGSLDVWSAYRQLRRENPVPFGALLQFGEVSVLSTSPERFLRISGDGWLESKPIKGTRPRGSTPDHDDALRLGLAAAEKDRAENLMIVDLVRNDLSRHAEISTVHVPALFAVESYATVHQLVSTVRGRLRPGTSPVDGVRAAFPGGSMTGAPKVRTMEIIDELEEAPRGVYSGAIGYFSLSGAADFNIVIRTVVVTPTGVSYGVGGAIVALSDPDDEYRETVVKAAPFLRLIGAAFP